MGERRVCMGGKAVPDDMLLKEWVLKAWAKDGRD